MRKNRKKPILLSPRKKRVPDFFDIPESAYKDVCQIELLGDSTVSVEGCDSVLTYSETSVSVRAGERILVVDGTGLILGGFDAERILIRGSITSLRYM